RPLALPRIRFPNDRPRTRQVDPPRVPVHSQACQARGADMKIYGDEVSGNCLKVKWTADFLGLPYEWVAVDIMKGESRTPEYLAINPWGQVPAVVLDDGRTLSQSNAIILHLAEGSALVPADAYDRARMHEWLFW